MVYKELSEADKQAYMDFWSERKPESFALEAWVGKLNKITREFRTNTSKERLNISKYVDNYYRILAADAASSPVYGVYDGMSIIDSHMRFIHKHEKRGTSLMAVSAIEGRLNEVGTLFKAGEQEENWAPIIEGEKRLRAPLDVEAFVAYDQYSWLNECHSAQDVAATLWTNFFHKLTNEIRRNEDVYSGVFHIGMIAKDGFGPRFSAHMPLGAVSAPDGASFQDVVAGATSCLFSPSDVFSKPVHQPWVAKAIVGEFLDKADSFVERMPSNLLVKLKS